MAKEKASKEDAALRRKSVERSGLKYKPNKATKETPTAASADVVEAAAKEQYGDQILMVAADAPGASIVRLSSGVFAINYALGGGFPMGKTSQIYGLQSSGKTSLALKTAASAQQTCRHCASRAFPRKIPVLVNQETGERREVSKKKKVKPEEVPEGFQVLVEEDLDDLVCKCGKFESMTVIWLDLERDYKNVWATAMGVDCQKVRLSQPEYAEAAMDMTDALMRTGEIDLFVIDSIAQMTPKKEIEASYDAEFYALLAKKVNRMMRKVGSAQSAQGGLMNATATTVLMINQVRDSMSTYGSHETRPGGRGQLFANSTEIRLRRKEYKSFTRKEVKYTAAIVTAFVCKKNRTSVPETEGVYQMWLRKWNEKETGIFRVAGDTDERNTIISYAQQYGVLTDDPPYIFKEEKFESDEDLDYRFDTDQEFAWELRQHVMETMLDAVP